MGLISSPCPLCALLAIGCAATASEDSGAGPGSYPVTGDWPASCLEADSAGLEVSGPATGEMSIAVGDSTLSGLSAWAGASTDELAEGDYTSLVIEGCRAGEGELTSMDGYLVAGLYEGDLTSVPIVETFSAGAGSEVAGVMSDWELLLGAGSDYLPMEDGTAEFDDGVLLGTAAAGSLRVEGAASYVLGFDLRWWRAGRRSSGQEPGEARPPPGHVRIRAVDEQAPPGVADQHPAVAEGESQRAQACRARDGAPAVDIQEHRAPSLVGIRRRGPGHPDATLHHVPRVDGRG